MDTFINSWLGFGINLAIVFVIVRCIYFPKRRNRDYVFTFFAFNTIIYFVMSLLNNSELSLSVGFGLFAIFSVIRYRTNTIPIREMTYLFVLIALPVVNSILFAGQSYWELTAVNLAVIGVLFVLEKGWGFTYETFKVITYERIDMVHPDNWPLLLEDLKQRTGLPITRLEVGKLNFLRDTAEITIYYDAADVETAQVRLTATYEQDLSDD